MPALERIPFHGDMILALTDERTGKEYVLPKPIVELFGIGWRAQFAKLTKQKLFAKGVMKITIPTAGGEQEALVLERRLVHPWLLSIDAGRIAPDLQAKLLRYQEECAEVLDAHFSKQSSVVRSPLDAYPEMKAIVDMAHAVAEQRQIAAKLLAEQDAMKAELLTQQADIIATQLKTIEALEEARHARETAERLEQDATWITVYQYCWRYRLLDLMDAHYREAYGRHLVKVCKDRGIKVYNASVAYEKYDTENTYPISIMNETCDRWLKSQSAQLIIAKAGLPLPRTGATP